MIRKFLTKLLFKLLNFDFDFGEEGKLEDMSKWLYDCYEDKGFKAYYSLRKKAIKDYLALGLDRENYLRNLGRLEELYALKNNIEKNFENVKKREKGKK